MLTIRTAATSSGHDPDLSSLERLLAEHPLADHLAGTVAIGIGGANPWRAGDVRPWVAVLAGHAAPTRLQRAHLAHADGIVARDAVAARAAAAAAPRALVVVVADPDERAFLRGATPRDTIEAWAEVAEHQALAEAIGVSPRGDTRPQTAELVVELIIALGN